MRSARWKWIARTRARFAWLQLRIPRVGAVERSFTRAPRRIRPAARLPRQPPAGRAVRTAWQEPSPRRASVRLRPSSSLPSRAPPEMAMTASPGSMRRASSRVWAPSRPGMSMSVISKPGRPDPQHLQRVCAVFGLAHAIARFTQPFGEQSTHQRVVVYHENLDHFSVSAVRRDSSPAWHESPIFQLETQPIPRTAYARLY